MDCIHGDVEGEVTMSELVRYYTPDLGERLDDIEHARKIGERNAIQMVALILELDSNVSGKSVFSDVDATISYDDLKHVAKKTPPKYETRLYEHETKNGSSVPVYNTDHSLKLTEYGKKIYEQAEKFVTRHTRID